MSGTTFSMSGHNTLVNDLDTRTFGSNPGEDMPSTQVPSVKQTAHRLKSMFDGIWRMGDRDECSLKHVNHAVAAIVCGKSWRDGVDYASPASTSSALETWPWPGAGTVEEELTGDWNEDQNFRDRVDQLFANPNFVAAGRKQIADWQIRLVQKWEKVEALYMLVGRDRFLEAALTVPICESYLGYYLEKAWSNDLSPNERLTLRRLRDKRPPLTAPDGGW